MKILYVYLKSTLSMLYEFVCFCESTSLKKVVEILYIFNFSSFHFIRTFLDGKMSTTTVKNKILKKTSLKFSNDTTPPFFHEKFLKKILTFFSYAILKIWVIVHHAYRVLLNQWKI